MTGDSGKKSGEARPVGQSVGMASSDTRLLLIRHGESVAQVKGFLSGHNTCVGLSDLGRTQAGALRDRLVASGELGSPDLVYTSNLERAVETANIISPAFAEVPRANECEWCEIRAGEAEGLTYEEFRARHRTDGDPFAQFEVTITTLTNGKLQRKIRSGIDAVSNGFSAIISRADVADFMLLQLTDSLNVRKTPGIMY